MDLKVFCPADSQHGNGRYLLQTSACLLCALVMLSGCKQQVSAGVAATVNSRPVTYVSLHSVIAAQFPNNAQNGNDEQAVQVRLDTLRTLIDQEIMVQRAEKAGLLASDSDVDAKFNEYKVGYTNEGFEKQLSQRKMTMAQFKTQIRRELSVQKLLNKEIGSHISISDADVTAFYNAHKGSYNFAENQVRLAQILVTPGPDPNVHNLRNDKAQTEERAREKIQMLQMRLRQGEDFNSLAQNYSEDVNFAANGGDMGFIPQSSLDKVNPDLRKAIMDMAPGQISPILHTSEGYRIIKVISKQPAGQRLLTDPRVQENIRSQLFQRKDQALRDAFIEVARDEAQVKNFYADSVLASRDSK